MFSANTFHSFEQHDDKLLFDWLWDQFAPHYDLLEILLLRVDMGRDDFKVVSAYGVPVEPFNGSERRSVIDVVNDCFARFPKPHVHNIGHLALANIVRRFSKKTEGTNRVWFIPVTCYGTYFVFLGFPHPKSKVEKVPDEIYRQLDRILFTASHLLAYREAQERLKITELFVREVGHDIASSVQAIIAKTRTIVDGRVTGQAVGRKAAEIEAEILAAYRTAEFLGTAVDPNYQLSELIDFDLAESATRTIDYYSSEAAERHVTLKLECELRSVPLWGDARAVEQSIGQLLLNAIKYANGGTDVAIRISYDGEFARLNVSDEGLPLPIGEDLNRMWDFGFRGRGAKELHVNGSGIGLYTVRKIVGAHYGLTGATGNARAVNFYFLIPKKADLKRKLGLLV